MTTIEYDDQLLFLNEKFGYITEKQVVILKNSVEEKINIDSIKRVNLIKKRLLLINLILLLVSVSLFISIYFNFNYNQIEKHYIPFFIGSLFLLYSFILRFYSYRIIIKEKNNKTHELPASQFDRKIIKKFYYSIVERIPEKNNKDLFR